MPFAVPSVGGGLPSGGAPSGNAQQQCPAAIPSQMQHPAQRRCPAAMPSGQQNTKRAET